MAAPTDAELLEAGRLAIQILLTTGQRVAFGGRVWEGWQLKDLREYVASLATSTGTAPNRYASFSKGVT